MFNLDYLAKKTGVSRRTVRYYIQRGLLPPPLGQKRGSYYTEAHLERLQLILKFSAKGVPLIQIKKALSSDSPDYTTKPKITIPRKIQERIEISRDVELVTRQDFFDDDELIKIKEFIVQILEEKRHDQS